MYRGRGDVRGTWYVVRYVEPEPHERFDLERITYHVTYYVERARWEAALRVFTRSMALVMGPTPPGTGVMALGDFLHAVEVNVADQAVVIETVDPDVDDGRSWLDVGCGDHARHSDRRHHDVSLASDLGEIAGS